MLKTSVHSVTTLTAASHSVLSPWWACCPCQLSAGLLPGAARYLAPPPTVKGHGCHPEGGRPGDRWHFLSYGHQPAGTRCPCHPADLLR